MCHVIKVSRNGYYDWIKRPQSDRRQHQTKLSKKIRQLFDEKASTAARAWPRI